jgi:hypothetical protein
MHVVAPRQRSAQKGPVQRFFFHLYDDTIVGDDEGRMLAGPEAALAAALKGARALICEEVKHGRLNLAHRIEVEDETGEQVLVLSFGDAFEFDEPDGSLGNLTQIKPV